jgi:mannose-1-phosphate guanylyltransferase
MTIASPDSLKALILVGGFGTRLRPLTFTVPKPLVPFCNIPILEHQIKAAVTAGCTEIILAVGFQPDQMLSRLTDMENKYHCKIRVSIENEPLGTGGPLKLAEKFLTNNSSSEGCIDSKLANDNIMLVFNSDVICEFPLLDFIKFHKSHGGKGSIMVTKVSDPSKFGVVVFNSTDHNKIDKFVEKPTIYISDQINAGIYVLNTSIISERIPSNTFTMLEKDVFPQMAQDQELYAYPLQNYWADIGQPKDYLIGMVKHLSHHNKMGTGGHPTQAPPHVTIIDPVCIADSVVFQGNTVIGPNVTIGEGCVIGAGVRIKNSAVFDNCKISDYTLIDQSIIGWKSNIGKYVHIKHNSVLGENVQIADECILLGSIILPHKSINQVGMELLEFNKIYM